MIIANKTIYVVVITFIAILSSVAYADNQRVIVKFRKPAPTAIGINSVQDQSKVSPTLVAKNLKLGAVKQTKLDFGSNQRKSLTLGISSTRTDEYEYQVVEFDQTADISNIIHTYQNDPDVIYAEKDELIQLPPEERPLEGLLGVKSITAESIALQLQTAPDTTVVAIVDSGIEYSHDYLTNLLWVNPGEDLNRNGLIETEERNQQDDDGNGVVDDFYGARYSSLSGYSGDPQDEYGHGTHVAGIVVDSSTNADRRVTARLMGLRFLDSQGRGYSSDAASAILYAVNNGAKIINCSWGYSNSSSLLLDAVGQAKNAGVLIVAAAGNYNSSSPLYPGSYDSVMCVAALDAYDYKASFSNYGSQIDLAAPGVGIYSCYLNNSYRYMSGTSMAAPHIAGSLAILRSAEPGWSQNSISNTMFSAVDDIVVPLSSGGSYPGKDIYTGYGKSNKTSILAALGISDEPVQTDAPVYTMASDTLTISNVLNYPNPVTALGNTTFGFNVSEAVEVEIKIYNTNGRLLNTLTQAVTPISNYAKVSYDCTDSTGNRLKSDVYFYVLKAMNADSNTLARGKLVVLN